MKSHIAGQRLKIFGFDGLSEVALDRVFSQMTMILPRLLINEMIELAKE
jgi:hypothetical protein